MNDAEILQKMMTAFTAIVQLQKCILLEYMITTEKTDTTKAECLGFISACQPFDTLLTETKIKANHENLALALDVVVKAQECAKNEVVFGTLEREMLKYSTDIITTTIQALAIAIDHRK